MDPREYSSAVLLLEIEEKQLAVREQLAEACQKPVTVRALERAIEAGKAVGLARAEYSGAVEMLEIELTRIRVCRQLAISRLFH